MSDRYVQSKYSKDAPLWKVAMELDDSWNCSTESVAYLPKSEYVEVHAPERWEHLLVCSSIRCEPTYFDAGTQRIHIDMNGQFVIERKVNP